MILFLSLIYIELLQTSPSISFKNGSFAGGSGNTGIIIDPLGTAEGKSAHD